MAQIGEPVPDGALDVALNLSSLEAELYQRAWDDPDRQIRMLKREFALLRTVEEPTPHETAKLQALSILLTERQVDLQALERAVIIDVDVAPTPTTGMFMARPGRTARTLDYNMHGQGPPTPEVRPPEMQRGIGTPVSGDPLHGESPAPRSSDQ